MPSEIYCSSRIDAIIFKMSLKTIFGYKYYDPKVQVKNIEIIPCNSSISLFSFSILDYMNLTMLFSASFLTGTSLISLNPR